MSRVADTWMTQHEQCGSMLCFFCSFFMSEAKTLSTPETPKVFCGFSNTSPSPPSA